MTAKSRNVLIFLALVQMAAIVPIVMINPDEYRRNNAGWIKDEHAIGIVLGCLFAEVSVAATWIALGPLSIGVRFFGSLCWLALVIAAFLINISMQSPSTDRMMRVLLEFGGSVLAMWLLIQTPLWMARAIYRFRIEPTDSQPTDGNSRRLQFGIRQLLIVTAAVAAVLALGRALLQWEHNGALAMRNVQQTLVTMTLIVICNALVAFIVITGTLLLRSWLIAIVIGLCGAAAVTMLEWELLGAIEGLAPDRELAIIFALTNGIQFGWLLANIAILRWAGFRLVEAATPSAS